MGLRNCPGMALSRIVLFDFVSILLLNYDIDNLDNGTYKYTGAH